MAWSCTWVGTNNTYFYCSITFKLPNYKIETDNFNFQKGGNIFPSFTFLIEFEIHVEIVTTNWITN